MSTGNQPFLSHLISQMRTSFDEGETVDLCLHFDVSYGDLPGQGNAAKIRELALYLAHRQRLPGLISYLRQERPLVTWPDIPPDFAPPATASNPPTPHNPTMNIGQVKGSNVIIGGVQNIDQLHIETASKPPQKDTSTRAMDESVDSPKPIKARLDDLVAAIPSLPQRSAPAKANMAKLVAEIAPLLVAFPAQYAADVERVVKSMESLHQQLDKADTDLELIEMYTQGLQRSAARLANDQPALEPLVARIITAISLLLSD